MTNDIWEEVPLAPIVTVTPQHETENRWDEVMEAHRSEEYEWIAGKSSLKCRLH